MTIRFRPKGQTRGELSIMACDSGRPLAERILSSLNRIIKNETEENSSFNLRLVDTEEIKFANGELKTVINENIRGSDLYIVQAIDDPHSENSVNDNLMALLTAIHAAYQSDADSITVIIPQFPYSRQERKKTREGITAKQVASFIETSGADRIITLDIHAEAIQGFFNKAKMEDLHASNPIIEYIKQKIDTSNLVVASADVGGADKARFYSKSLQSDLAIVDKARDYSKASVIESMRVVGEVEGKDVLMPDDMISTAGTIVNAAKLLKRHQARNIFVACSLPFFNHPAIERLAAAYERGDISMVLGTDAVFWGTEFIANNPWYHEITIAPLFAQVIYNINTKQSVSELLK